MHLYIHTSIRPYIHTSIHPYIHTTNSSGMHRRKEGLRSDPKGYTNEKMFVFGNANTQYLTYREVTIKRRNTRGCSKFTLVEQRRFSAFAREHIFICLIRKIRSHLASSFWFVRDTFSDYFFGVLYCILLIGCPKRRAAGHKSFLLQPRGLCQGVTP